MQDAPNRGHGAAIVQSTVLNKAELVQIHSPVLRDRGQGPIEERKAVTAPILCSFVICRKRQRRVAALLADSVGHLASAVHPD